MSKSKHVVRTMDKHEATSHDIHTRWFREQSKGRDIDRCDARQAPSRGSSSSCYPTDPRGEARAAAVLLQPYAPACGCVHARGGGAGARGTAAARGIPEHAAIA